MAKLDLFGLLGKSTPKANQTDRLTDVQANEQQAYISPIDYTEKLFEHEGKDRKLFGFFEFYKKRDYFDRYKSLAYFCLVLSYLFSLVSAYLSFPFLQQFLANDFPNSDVLFGAALTVVVLNEIIKHLSLTIAARTVFTYREKPYFSATLALLSVAFSVYACINGIGTTSQEQYKANKPKIEQFTSQYDSQIAKAEQEIKELKQNRVSTGEIEYNSQKAIARKDNKLTEWRDKAAKEKQKKLDDALIDYNQLTTKKSTFRQYAGYGIESIIVVCSLYWLMFMFKSSFEHSAHIQRKFLQTFTPQIPLITGTNNAPVIGFRYDNNSVNEQNNSDNGRKQPKKKGLQSKTTQNVTVTDVNGITPLVNAYNSPNTKSNKGITNYSYEDLTGLLRVNKQRLSAYKWKLKNNKGTETNNREKIARYAQEVERLEKLQQKYSDDEKK